MIDNLKIYNKNNCLRQSVFIEGDSLYRLIDPQGQSVFVKPHEFTNLLSEIHAAEKFLDPKMLNAAKITFDLANKTFKINDEDFQSLPNTPYKAPPSKSTIQSPPTQFEKQVQNVIGSNPRFKHLLFTENSAPKFRDLNSKDYDKIFITFQFNNTTSSLILDRKKKAAYFFDPLLTKNKQLDELAFGLKFHFRPNIWSPFKTFVNKSAHTHNSSDTEKLTLDFYKNMTKAYDVQAFFADAEAANSPQEPQPRSTIPTYGDGNCSMHAFGKIITVDNRPQYRWTDGNPRQRFITALNNTIENESTDEIIKYRFERSICEFLRETTKGDIDLSDERIRELAQNEKTLQDYFTYLNKGLYLNEHEVILFAYLVAKKNVEFHTTESGIQTINLGFDELVKIQHVPNDENPARGHWQRIF